MNYFNLGHTFASNRVTSLVAITVFFEMILIIHAADPTDLIQKLEEVTNAEICHYQLRNVQGKRMDCLKVFQPSAPDQKGIYYGVYHRLENGSFNTLLAKSKDLQNWSDLAKFDEHASQPTLSECDNGSYLLAYEKDAPNSCWIRLRYYKSLNHLIENQHSEETDLPRTLAPTAEGTPNIESVKLGKNGMEHSLIQLRFHYFKDVQVDQLARGTLTNFNTWKTTPSENLNTAFKGRGWNGNLGDRDRFDWRQDTYYLQETQRVKGDWSSWRISLCDESGSPIKTLSFQTDRKSKSFANPNATWVTDGLYKRKLIITLFLPSEGNHASEAGTLLYSIPFSL